VDAISAVMSEELSSLSSPKFYGMFAHGELGPSSFSGFRNEAGVGIGCTKHSMTSILSIHTIPDGDAKDEL